MKIDPCGHDLMGYQEKQWENHMRENFMCGLSHETRKKSRSSLLINCFTMAELLAVIAIIAILTSLLFPALKEVKEKGKQIACVNNMKQVGLCVNMYSQDFNNYIPAAYDTSKKWGEVLSVCGYFINKDILVCPSWSPNKFVLFDYAYGYRCYWGEDTVQRFQKIDELGKAFNTPISDYFILADSIHGSNPMQWYYLVMGNPGSTRRIHFRHSKKANTLFPDGHVTLNGRNYFQSQGTGIWSFQY